MRLVLFIAVICCLVSFQPLISDAYDTELKNLSIAMAEKITVKGKKKIAVTDFTNLQGQTTEFGRFLAEELSVNLTIESKGFEVIDRMHLKTLMKEHKLSAMAFMDANSVKKLGSISGVDAIVTGSYTPFGDTIRVTVKVIATDTAGMVTAEKANIPKTGAIATLLNKGIGEGAAIDSTTGVRTEGTGSSNPIVEPGSQPTKPRGRVILSEKDNNIYTWLHGKPYETTKMVYRGSVAFIPTGNNHFLEEFGVIGDEKGEIRRINFKLMLLKKEACLLFQAYVQGNWEHRWAYEGRVIYKGMLAHLKRKGITYDLPVNKWLDITVDLIDDLGAGRGKKLSGLAFSSDDGNIVIDDVTLLEAE